MKFLPIAILLILIFTQPIIYNFGSINNSIRFESTNVSLAQPKQWYEQPTKIIWFNGSFQRGEVGIKQSKNLWLWHPKGGNIKAREITQYFNGDKLAKIEIELAWKNSQLNRADLDILWMNPYEGRCTFKPNDIKIGEHIEKATFYYKKSKEWRMFVGATCWNGIITKELPFSEKIIIYEEPDLKEINVSGDSKAWIETYRVKEVNYSYVPIFSDFRSVLRITPNITFERVDDDISIGDLIYINYKVTLNLDDVATIGAECEITLPNGKIICLDSWDVRHKYAPISENPRPPYPRWNGMPWWKACKRFGLPEIPSSVYTLSPENNSYTFRWTFRAGMFGKYNVKLRLKNAGGFEKTISFEVKEPKSFQEKYALIFTSDSFSEVNAWANNYEMYDVLVNHYGFPASNVFSLMDGTCTKENLTALMSWLIENTDENATVVIWFSCHGGYEKNLDGDKEIIDGFLYLWGSPYSKENILTDEEMAKFIANLKSRKILLGGDACNGGEFGGRLDIGERINELIGNVSLNKDGVIVAVGAPWFRAEMVSTYGGAVFTLWFSAGLQGMKDFRGKDADDYGNKDGKISVEEAFKWAFIQMLTDNPLYPYDFNDNYKGKMYLI